MSRIIIFYVFITLPCFIFPQQGLVKTYYNNGDTLKSEINFKDSVRDGQAKFYYPNGKLKEELTYVNGKVEGLVQLYGENGKMREMANVENGKREGPTSLFDSSGNYLKDITYKNGMLVKEEEPLTSDIVENTAGKKESVAMTSSQKNSDLKSSTASTPAPPNSNDNNETVDPAYFLSAEVMPEPAGGMQSLLNKVVYPQAAKKNNIYGTVEVKTFIDKFGEVTSAKVVKGIGYGCDDAARIAVYYTKFKPGLIKGKPVNVQMIIPVEFKPENKN